MTGPVTEGGMGLGEAEAVLFATEVGHALGPLELIGRSPLRQLAYLVGVARRAVDLAVGHARRHRQFGVPIADFQAVSYPLATHWTRLTGWYRRLGQLAADLDDGHDIESAVAALAPVLRRDVFEAVSGAVHAHGAAGLVDENPISACYRAIAQPIGGDRGPRPHCRSTPADLLARRIPEDWTSPGTLEIPARTVTRLFTAAAEQFPAHTAVQMDDGGTLTYRELDLWSNRLAHVLRRTGVGPDSLVGVYLPRSIELVVALLGVLKAGGAFLPLDPDYPVDRVQMMIDDARAEVIVTQAALLEWLPESSATPICVDSDTTDAEDTAIDAAAGERLAYLMYTSGSSGRPKGVEVEHVALANRLAWDLKQFGLGPGDAVLQHTSPNFDIAVWEIFAPLVGGARLVLARPGGARDVDYLTEVMREHDITALAVVPSLLDVLLEVRPGLADVRRLRYVFCGGESLSPALCHRVFEQLPAAGLYNFYGPSEASIDATWWHCTAESIAEGVPIGQPLPNVRVYLLDDIGEPVPVGFTGELYVGGVCVARGYHCRPELTEANFLPDPFVKPSGARMYRTGDLGRYRSDGAIEFLGRADQQVKIRGFRIEPGEIESALEEHPSVRQAVVLARGERLVAYASRFRDTSADELTAYLRGRLPDHLVPSVITVLDSFPLMPNGKVDREALRNVEPSTQRDRIHHGSGHDGMVEAVAALMSQVLGLPEVGATDDFFALGGTSLQATRFVTRARTDLGLDLDLSSFVDSPTCVAVADRRRER
ncbi:amino acid adenylation domain-containing protein [Nocardia transvalensis]|uniref:amino acid adenylation domain-containing protein n=1 Tax=Nocardia transvalensis TaxID=37333 RepID=UPI00189612CA|nr:amino acid adenylation domain-containing protein [Nocardia transvalensis]MBF6330374.1 amino acid adenylation domain-containing protein [Nocardia transvalensis]